MKQRFSSDWLQFYLICLDVKFDFRAGLEGTARIAGFLLVPAQDFAAKG